MREYEKVVATRLPRHLWYLLKLLSKITGLTPSELLRIALKIEFQDRNSFFCRDFPRPCRYCIFSRPLGISWVRECTNAKKLDFVNSIRGKGDDLLLLDYELNPHGTCLYFVPNPQWPLWKKIGGEE